MENIRSKTPLKKNIINFLQTDFKNEYLSNKNNKNINFISKKNLFPVQKLNNNQNKPVERHIMHNNPNIVHINNIFNNVEQNENFKIKGGNYIYNNNNNQINYNNISAEEGEINPNNTFQNINSPNQNFYNYINNNKVNNLNNIGNQQLNKKK